MLRFGNLTTELLSIFGFYAALLALEFVFISFITGQERLRTLSFANHEDAVRHGSASYCQLNEQVERTRRISRNDVENVLMFLVIACLYMLTGPSPFFYSLQCGAYTFLRYLYAAVYKLEVPAPTRSVVYSIALYIVELPMVLIVLYNTF